MRKKKPDDLIFAKLEYEDNERYFIWVIPSHGKFGIYWWAALDFLDHHTSSLEANTIFFTSVMDIFTVTSCTAFIFKEFIFVLVFKNCPGTYSI